MKKVVLLTLGLMLGLCFQAQAQNEDYKIVVGATAGYSLTGALIKTTTETFSNATAKVTPALQLSVDYGLTKWFSIGLAGSFQSIGIDIPEYSYTDENLQTMTEAVNINFTRTTIAFRPLFHYGNSGNLDMYSGLRVQLIGRNFSETTTGDPNFNSEDITGIVDGSRVGVGIVPFGFRYFFTDNIGAGFELMIGAPYVASLSVNARF